MTVSNVLNFPLSTINYNSKQKYETTFTKQQQNTIKSFSNDTNNTMNIQEISNMINSFIIDHCDDINRYKCESKSLYRTCGYPAANPNSNPNAYCNEMRAYIKCAKCKTYKCKLIENLVHINKQEEL